MSRHILVRVSLVVGFALLAISGYCLALHAFDWNHSIGVGSTWSYDVSTPSGFRYNETETLRSLEVCGFRICGVYEMRSPSGTAIQWRTSDWQLERSLYVDSSGNSRDLVYDSGIRLYALPLAVGEKWSWDTGGTRTTTVQVRNGGTVARHERVLISDIARQVMRVESVDVPAGTFQAYVIDQYDENEVISQRIWFNPEVGAVKYIAGFGSVYHTLWELAMYGLVANTPLSIFHTRLFSVDTSLLVGAGALLIAVAVAAKVRRTKRIQTILEQPENVGR